MSDWLADQIAAFLDHITFERGVAPNTVSAYQNDLRQFREYLGGSAGLAAQVSDTFGLDSGTVAGFVISLRDKGYAQASIARKVAAVKSFFHYASENGLLPSNPAAALDSPRVPRSIPQAVDPDEIGALLDKGCDGTGPDDLRDRAMLTLLYHSGMRVSELVAIDVDDVDLEAHAICCRGRHDRIRQIPLTDTASRVISDYCQNGRIYLSRLDESKNRALFLNHRGTRLTRQGFWLIMKERARRAGVLSPMTPHALRHAFALKHLGMGTPLRDLKELLGHVNISTTQIYAQAGRQS